MEKGIMTTNEAADRLGVTPNRVRAMVTAGQLPALRLGQFYVIREKDLALVADRKAGRPPKAKPEPAKKARKKGARANG